MNNFIGAIVRIVDDDETICHSLSTYFKSQGLNTLTYISGEVFLAEDDLTVPGCIILDVRMPNMSGLEVHKVLLDRRCTVPVIFLSAHGDIQMAVSAIHEGAYTFLEKPPVPEELLGVVIKALLFSEKKARQDKEKEDNLELWNSLTKSEQQAAVVLAKGLRNADVAEILGISPWTVKSYKSSIYQKLACENPVELSDFLRLIGILSSES